MTDKEKYALKVIAAVFLVLVIAIGVTSWKRSYLPRVDSSTYQTVFLDNGQQYFGRLKKVGARYPYLTDIYYLQAKANPAEGVDLIKFGKELHGPEDRIYLNWQHVLFWENLAPDSPMLKSIAQEKSQRVNSQAAAPAAGK